MPTLRFVRGRAGVGKTRHCLDSIREILRKEPDGPPLILLAPEQSTFQLERALATTPGLDGLIRAHVLSFRRLAHRLFDELGGRAIPPAGNLKRLLILKNILASQQANLRYYGASAQTTGFAQRVDATLTEWRRYHFTSEDAERLRVQWQDSRTHAALGRKLHDLTLIEQEYRKAIADRFIDPEDYLERVAGLAAKSSLLRDAQIWVDGFADFTTLERRALMAILRVARSAEIALCLDPLTVDEANPLQGASERAPRPFAACERTHWLLHREATEAGLTLLDPLELFEPHRYATAPALRALEQRFFRPTAGGAPLSTERIAAGPELRVVGAQSLHAEVDFVALEALRMAREENVRYREMAIVTRDLDPCHDLLRAALSRLKIPFFMDRQREVQCHPLAELLSSASAIVASNWKTEDVVQALKTGLLPVSRDEADRLENHALAFGLNNQDWLKAEKWRPAGVESLHSRATGALEAFEKALGGNRWTTASVYAAALQSLMETLDAKKKIERWQEESADQGDHETAAVHRQVPELIEGLLHEWSDALGGEKLSRRDCAELLAEGLSALRMRLAPPTLDHLLVGSVERSRHPDLRVVFLLGMNTGIFPKASSEDVLLNDADRAILAAERVELAPSASERLLNEPYLAYIAMTRPSERLIITYSQTDEKCRLREPSQYLQRIREIIDVVPEDAAQSLREMQAIVDLPSLGAAVTAALGRQVRLEGEAPPFRPWPALLNMGRELDLEPSRPFHRRLAGVTYHNEAQLCPEMAQRLYERLFGQGMGVTSFETFAACQFRFFAHRGLRLKPREVAQLEASDRGSLVHDVLGRLFKRLQENGRGWHDVPAKQLSDWTSEIFNDCVLEFREGMLQTGARHRNMLKNLLESLHRRVNAIREESLSSRFHQVEAEMAFGGDEGVGYELQLSNGQKVQLQGRIDRMDLCEDEGSKLVRIIDYKTTSKTFDLRMVYAGLQLQLPLYLLAICESGSFKPVGFFFCPILPEQSDALELHAEYNPGTTTLANYKGKGFVSSEFCAQMDIALPQSHESRFWNIKLRKDGLPDSRYDAIDHDKFMTLLEYTKFKLHVLAEEILTGSCAVSPCPKMCKWCEFHAFCRFDDSLQSGQEIPKLGKREEAFEAMHGAMH